MCNAFSRTIEGSVQQISPLARRVPPGLVSRGAESRDVRSQRVGVLSAAGDPVRFLLRPKGDSEGAALCETDRS